MTSGVKLLVGVVALLAVGVGVYLYAYKSPPQLNPEQTGTNTAADPALVEVLAHGLDIPWGVAFLPDGRMLVSERSGQLLLMAADGSERSVLLSNVGTPAGEAGLLGVAVHPEFDAQGFVYLYFSDRGENGQTRNSVEQAWFANDELSMRAPIIENIPGAPYHDGGRIEFGPDGLLYITTGDATVEELAQEKDSLAGKILRVEGDGSIPEGNPFGTAVYSYGHRNPQGLAWDDEGRLWSTEHGRSGILSGMDEINHIVPGANYGWPEVEGDEIASGMVSPVLHSGADDTWAPASAAYLNGSLFFGGLRGEALYEAVLDGERVTELKRHFHGEFGRIRTVTVGPDGLLYVTTSNRDGRGEPDVQDDLLLRVNPEKLQ